MDDIILEVKNLSKYYAGVKALDDVTVSFSRGEVHALSGENGAGKSTLIKTLTGAITPTSGQIILNGEVLSKLNPIEAMEKGIAAVYQEFNLIPYLSAAENVFFGKEKMSGAFVDRRAMNAEVSKMLDGMGIAMNPSTLAMNLGIAYQQITEIVKAVAADSQILILDEPTAPLTNNETNVLFNIIRNLKAKGVTIIYISHRLEEIFEICDRVSVMRDGKYIVTKNTSETNRKELISFMVGRELGEHYPDRENPLGSPVLKVDGLTTEKLKGVSFKLNKGEILGFGGLVGAGRTEIMQAIFGADRIISGKIELNGKPVKIKGPDDALKKGIGLIPEDRKNQGVLMGLSVKSNITFSSLNMILRGPFISKYKDEAVASEYVKKLSVKTPSIHQLVRNLSGGNQQKVVLAKMLATQCDILIFDEPTRGIDVGAKQEIYNLMRNLTDEAGKSIIMVSSEMPELIGMSDRIIVMHDGRIAGEIAKGEFSQELILEYASGMTEHRRESQ